MTIKMQKAPQKKIAKIMAKPAKPAGEGVGMEAKKSNRGGNLGKWLHPAKAAIKAKG